jgi:hypothetical protein
MQRKNLVAIVIAGAMILALAVMASAQSMSTSSGKQADNMAAKKETAVVKSTEMTTKSNQEMMSSKMGTTKESATDDWEKIEAHYNEMMTMTDPAMLKTELAKHQEMMMAYRTKMIANMEPTHKKMASHHSTIAKGENTKAMGPSKAKTVPTKH